MHAPAGPHRAIAADDPRERLLAELFDRLWEIYRTRVSYVRTYESVLEQRKATFVNDHIAFRTFATQRPLNGIATLSRIFEALGYRAAGVYQFEDKHLSAVHFQHPNARLPKLFISELRAWELGSAAEVIDRATAEHRPPVTRDVLHQLHDAASVRGEHDRLLDLLVPQFLELPWPVPERSDVEQLNTASQYAAWVLVHGYNVNHFTSLVNSHGVDGLRDLEGTIAALQQAGVPMKAEIEGEPGSKLRQTATEAVTIDVEVLEAGRLHKMPWSYAYFELAQRDPIVDPATGKTARFEGFLGSQATNLFEMTRVR